ncbi:Altered inheritance of mitochondria protein 44 [Kluyveromyces marxianus]|nr:Altered inheritance of mitochondria protein 44 [Kluyveromyces marxianus]KAG0686263.1 Altered inheritance of mitochondria protein 44 [Kluyveromyces marxianus]
MIRTPTRTKTKSYNGSQADFRFPYEENQHLRKISEHALNNHHLLNEQLNKCPEDDTHSLHFSDYTTSNSNSGNSSNGYYSFANISDNTTNPERLSVTRNSKGALNSNRYSYISSSGSSVQYPGTLAPERTPKICSSSNSPKFGKPSEGNFDMQCIPETFSAVTSSFTLPTADNISFQISSNSDTENNSPNNHVPLLQRTVSDIKLNSRRKSLVKRSTSLSSRRSQLKRSNAIRCKGGMLEYFTKAGLKLKRYLKKLYFTVKRRFFSYKHRGLSKSDKKKTTSHLMRSNGYLANIKRSQTIRSLASHLESNHLPVTTPTKFQNINNDDLKTPGATHHSLRRTPSSIKRAASILVTNNSITDSKNNLDVARNYSNKLVRSQPSLNLNMAVRQPSIVVKNKVIPLSRFDNKSYCIREEDEEEEEDAEDEYVIDTNKMQSLCSDMDSITSSLHDESIFQDALSYSSSAESLPESVKVTNARKAWDSYLRAVISQRIQMRLQIAKFQASQDNDVYKELLEAITTDYESDAIFSNEESNTEEESISKSEYDSGSDIESLHPLSPAPESIKSTPLIIPQSFCDSFTSLSNFQSSVQTSVRRTLTLPVGITI